MNILSISVHCPCQRISASCEQQQGWDSQRWPAHCRIFQRVWYVCDVDVCDVDVCDVDVCDVDLCKRRGVNNASKVVTCPLGTYPHNFGFVPGTRPIEVDEGQPQRDACERLHLLFQDGSRLCKARCGRPRRDGIHRWRCNSLRGRGRLASAWYAWPACGSLTTTSERTSRS